MSELTERQKNILEIVVRDYIDSAVPISSKFIEEKYDLGISPATIRNDLYELIDKGYLYQPYTSAGRVPTDKGYRFFVDFSTEREMKRMENRLKKEVEKMREEVEGKIRFMRELTRFLAQTSSSLTVSYFPRESIFLKEGMGGVLQDPEFEDIAKVRNFMEMVDDFEKNIDFFLEEESSDCVRIYIGSEAPFSKRYDFSVLISPCVISRRKGLLAIMGPKRMPYTRNVRLVESIIKLLENEKNGRRER